MGARRRILENRRQLIPMLKGNRPERPGKEIDVEKTWRKEDIALNRCDRYCFTLSATGLKCLERYSRLPSRLHSNFQGFLDAPNLFGGSSSLYCNCVRAAGYTRPVDVYS